MHRARFPVLMETDQWAVWSPADRCQDLSTVSFILNVYCFLQNSFWLRFKYVNSSKWIKWHTFGVHHIFALTLYVISLHEIFASRLVWTHHLWESLLLKIDRVRICCSILLPSPIFQESHSTEHEWSWSETEVDQCAWWAKPPPTTTCLDFHSNWMSPPPQKKQPNEIEIQEFNSNTWLASLDEEAHWWKGEIMRTRMPERYNVIGTGIFNQNTLLFNFHSCRFSLACDLLCLAPVKTGGRCRLLYSHQGVMVSLPHESD